MKVSRLNIAKQIEQIRDSRILVERIQKRLEYENKAKRTLLTKLSILTWSSLDSILSIMDSDLWHGEEIEGRFYPLF